MLFNVTAFFDWKGNPLGPHRTQVRSTVQSGTYVEARYQKEAGRKWVASLTPEEQEAVGLVVVYRTPNKLAGGYRGSDFEYRPKLGWETLPGDAYDEAADLERMGGEWRES